MQIVALVRHHTKYPMVLYNKQQDEGAGQPSRNREQAFRVCGKKTERCRVTELAGQQTF